MLMCSISKRIAHETAGAARIRSSLRPLFSRARCSCKTPGASRRGIAKLYLSVIARSEATKQSSYPLCREMDCFASLAMTGLENEQGQLIKRIGDFEAHQNQRGDHQIKAEMHEGLETKY